MRAYASAIVAAPVSCRAATYRAPAATIALVTSKLPEPTTPKTASTPARTSAAPTAAATVGPPALTARCSLLDERQDPRRGAGPADDRQRRRDQHRAGGRQQREVLQLGQPVLAAAEQRRVARERWVERVRRSR